MTITPKTQNYRLDVFLNQLLTTLPIYMRDAEAWVIDSALPSLRAEITSVH